MEKTAKCVSYFRSTMSIFRTVADARNFLSLFVVLDTPVHDLIGTYLLGLWWTAGTNALPIDLHTSKLFIVVVDNLITHHRHQCSTVVVFSKLHAAPTAPN